MEGFILLHRRLLGWSGGRNTMRVFIHLLLKANFEPKKWRGVTVGRGQCATSLAEIAGELGLSERNVRTAIKHLKSTGEVTHERHPDFGLYTIKNYDAYQANDTRSDRQVTPDRHTKEQLEQVKNLKKETPPKGGVKKESAAKAKYGEFENVLLDGQEHGKLVDSLGDIGAAEYIEHLSAYLAQTGHRYKPLCHPAELVAEGWKPVKRTPAPHRMKTGRWARDNT
ncbi:MAG: hypothetical protein ACLRWF_05885 [Ruthenibacterium sp.]